MDIEIRVAKVEVEVEALKEIARQNAEMIARLESRLEQGFTEQRAVTDRSFAEHRAATERGFAELRKELRWQLGITLAGFGAILGLMGRIAGLY